MRKKSLYQKILTKLIVGILAFVSVFTIGKWLKKQIQFFSRNKDESLAHEEVINENKHVHNFSNWHAINDYLEEGTCSCGLKETKEHLYNVATNYSSMGNDMHNIERTYMCPNCHYSFKTYEKESCTYTNWQYNAGMKQNQKICVICGNQVLEDHFHTWGKLEYSDNDFEYYKCHTCGKLKAIKHNFKTEEGDSVIFYSCLNKDCDYNFNERGYHEHNYILEKEDSNNTSWLCSCGEKLVIDKMVVPNKKLTKGLVLTRKNKNN